MQRTPTRPAPRNRLLRAGYSQSSKEAMKNPWFLSVLAITGVFLIVNLVFVVFAISTNPGLVADDYYEKGREYEKNVVTRLAARNRLNWETRLEIPDQIYTNRPDVYRFTAVDSRGVSIMDADVQLMLYRPSDADADFERPVEQIAPGLYQTRLVFPLPGIWDINLRVTHGDDVYHQAQRISVLTP